ncbi:GNAT family N-acetyltransferase [Nocardioides sp.]|uniref:GNAT family N-acetyltransferase n=1 Tax=Nocardioides sp. TaxID=35761 RepID=UPI002ED4E3AA
MDYDLVRIGPDDWKAFRDIRLRSLADAPAAFGSRYDDWVGAPEERWRARLTAVPLTVLARAGEETVGVTSGAPEGEESVELISMWVDPAARGSDVTAALIDAVVEWATEQGRSTYLMVRRDNARAIRAYEKAGFVDRGVPADWPPDEPPENRMEHRPDHSR